MQKSSWGAIYSIIALIIAGFVAFLIWSVPRDGDETEWTGQLIDGGWMAWSFPVALFFCVIATLLIVFTLLALRFPETPRVGVLRIETTRGDRLFITLLGSAFINLAWLGLTDASQLGALVVCLIYAAAVFRWV